MEIKPHIETDPAKFIRLDTAPVTTEQAQAFEADLQVGMPDGWKVTAIFELHGDHHRLVGYRLDALGEVFNLGTFGETDEWHDGWAIQLIGGAFYSEFTVTAPDGTIAVISDIMLA